ncbi:MAG: ATP-binding protein [Chthoniobacteraceae bacterium]
MTGRFRIFPRRVGQDIRAWPTLALLLLVVLVAIGCVLWFMREAMRNERLAVREKLAVAYRGHLTLKQKLLQELWQRALERFDADKTGAALFAEAVRGKWAESVVCFDGNGRVSYPQIDTQNRLADANADLLALEGDPQNPTLARRLRDRVNDYTSPLPAAQRRFLMRELQRLAPGVELPTLAAEELAASFLELHPQPELPDSLRTTELPNVWSVASPGKRALALYSTTALRTALDEIMREPPLPAEVRIAVIAPGEDAITDATLVTTSLAPQFPGWRLALTLDDRQFFDSTANRRVENYLWIGCAVIASMTLLATFLARSFGRQVQLARLKNDLVATVSHELKTPLTAMRALVETLLETEKLDEKTTREYLQLLATENARLSRLIENFLTFSRLERNKFHFHFASVPPAQIVANSVAAFGERAHQSGCTFETKIADPLPALRADADALTTALLNLLDNAWKYSGDEKHVTLRAEQHNGSVRFAVEDNGLGLSPHERARVFERFYQTDQRLARTAGGCGLGLSIVRSIVEAHRGSVSVASEPGRGSTFTIEIPASTA